MARFSTGDPGAFSVSVMDDFRQVASPITLPWPCTVSGMGGQLGGVEYGLWVPQGPRVNVSGVVGAGTYWLGFIRPQVFQTFNWVPGAAGWTLGTGVNGGSMAGAQPTTNWQYPGVAGISAWIDADEYTVDTIPAARVWGGSSWVDCNVYGWDGVGWHQGDSFVWDGTRWIQTR